jgi:hypothetical protein
MAETFDWSKETYERSVTRFCWWYSVYDESWEDCAKHGNDLREDAELREIVRLEMQMQPLPDWAVEIVRDTIRNIPPCGHHTFPAAYLRVVDAIGSQKPVAFNYTCYTADASRKREAMDYCFCLDAWLAGASAEAAATELNALGHLRLDWRAVCGELWRLLGQHTEAKDLLIERTLMQLRHWIKLSVWPDDPASQFGRDQYLGDYDENGSPATDNGNPKLQAPSFRLKSSPRVQRLEAQLERCSPNWPWFKQRIGQVDGMNLCAPKTFRHLERLLWAIARERPLEPGESVPGFLSAEITYPNHDEAARWWRQFMAALRGWHRGECLADTVGADIARRLGPRTSLKEWLVRLYVRRLELCETSAETGRLVNPKPGARRGTKPLCLGQQPGPAATGGPP